MAARPMAAIRAAVVTESSVLATGPTLSPSRITPARVTGERAGQPLVERDRHARCTDPLSVALDRGERDVADRTPGPMGDDRHLTGTRSRDQRRVDHRPGPAVTVRPDKHGCCRERRTRGVERGDGGGAIAP